MLAFPRLAAAALVFAAAFAVTPSRASAQPEAWVDGRFYVETPSYFTAVRGEMIVSFRDVLPWGAKVTVHYGLGGVEQDATGSVWALDWLDQGDVEAVAVAPYVWTAKIDHPLYERGQPRWFQRLQFVYRVSLPDGTFYYVRGGDSTMGYLEAILPDAGEVPAVTRDQAAFRRLLMRPVARS